MGKKEKSISSELIKKLKGKRTGAPNFSGNIFSGLMGSDIGSAITETKINRQQSKNDILSAVLGEDYQENLSRQKFMGDYSNVYELLYGG